MRSRRKGITLISLVVTVTVLIILAGISIYSGKGVIERAKLEELKTNMLLIQAKAREYVEEADFKIGIVSEEERTGKTETIRSEIYVESQGLQKASNIPEQVKVSDPNACYYLTDTTKQKWGLEKLEKAEEYLIEFDEKNVKVEVYNIEGYDGAYSLTAIDQIQK